jgi:hypothetical protein
MRATWAVVLLLGCGSGTVAGEGDADPGTTPEPMTLPRADVDEVEDDVAWMRTDASAPGGDLGVTDVPAPQRDVVTAPTDVVTAPTDVVTAPTDVVTAPMDAGTTLPEQRCTLRSTTFDAAMQEIDVGPTSATRLRFTIPDVPAGVTSATLRFDTFDADHPNEEGRITVNGVGPFQIPASVGWDNTTQRDQRVDVTRAVREGTNVVEFGPGPLARSFYRIGRVQLDVVARATRCGATVTPPVDAGVPTGPRVTRRLGYMNATYTLRRNFVFRCDANYAYTARGDHASVDCTGGYNPDGTLRGTATFTFPNVVPGAYDIVVTSRHSSNRNALGALFVVNGEPARIDQRTGPGTLTLVDDTWGRRSLAGTVTVVLDATNNRGSDSVSAVTLRPVP